MRTALLGLLGLVLAVAVGFGVHAITRGTISLPVVQLERGTPLAPAPATTEPATTGGATTATEGGTETDDDGSGRGHGRGRSGGDSGDNSGSGGDDD